ncbi:poly(A) polymerase [Candidatus Phycorickettsia trachydisci]|uniref:Poly(A) polymerase n=1 Tax=Candidatus Phycorickettsia trachydisci TaxID=2115978 RepID=A0A2P1P9C6_9RICK|nr:CCA tRNA nucleotidyltransferase [Candidatus Phycorickettsia trachydisci]AVP87882.1 poly(A) polymerase [Candidatus Phycorickettsia trachydisci]
MKKELKFASQYLKDLISILGSTNARIVGGCVRDALLGIKTDDFDIATRLVPDEVTRLLEAKSINVIPTGLKHGTVTAIMGGEKFEITTLRQDLKCDGRHAKVAFTDDFKEDASRRDFTINALSYDVFTHEVFDYFEGLKHLSQRKVVFIGEAHKRIEEDHLRILRFFRFSAYYAKDFDSEGLKACNALADRLKEISRERINMEFDKILLASNNVKTLYAMQDVLPSIFEPLDIGTLEKILDLSKKFETPLTLNEIYSLLFWDHNLSKLKFDNARKKQIRKFAEFVSNIANANLRAIWINSNYPCTLYILFANLDGVINNDQTQEFLELIRKPKPTFPVNGGDLLNLGYSGKNVGDVLDYLRAIWVNHNFQISKKDLIKCIKQ